MPFYNVSKTRGLLSLVNDNYVDNNLKEILAYIVCILRVDCKQPMQKKKKKKKKRKNVYACYAKVKCCYKWMDGWMDGWIDILFKDAQP